MWTHLVDLPRSSATEHDWNIGEYRVRGLFEEPDWIRTQQHNQVQLAVLILPDKEIALFVKRLIRLIDGTQVLPVELHLEARIRVQRREDLIGHDHRARMGLSEFVIMRTFFRAWPCRNGAQQSSQRAAKTSQVATGGLEDRLSRWSAA